MLAWEDINLAHPPNETHPLNRGLVGWWVALPNRTGKRWLDLSAQGNHGTLTNGPTWRGAPRLGLTLDGSNDYVDLGNPVSLQLSGAMTVVASVVFKGVTTGADEIYSRAGASSDCGVRLLGEVTQKISFVIASNATTEIDVSSVNNRSLNLLYHIAGVYEPSVALRLYLDGKLNNSNTTSIPASQRVSTAGPYIGRRGDNVALFDGQIFEVRIYNRALPHPHIRQLYDLSRLGSRDLLNRSWRTWLGSGAQIFTLNVGGTLTTAGGHVRQARTLFGGAL